MVAVVASGVERPSGIRRASAASLFVSSEQAPMTFECVSEKTSEEKPSSRQLRNTSRGRGKLRRRAEHYKR
jgi:hypothetical protein